MCVRMFNVALTDHTTNPPLIEREILGKMANVYCPDRRLESDDELVAFARDADAIIYSSGLILKGGMMDRIPNLKMISMQSIGFDVVDVKAATERRILVSNVPDYCVEEVADHAVSLALAQLRGLFPLDVFVRKSRWGAESGTAITLHRLSTQVFGLVGFGNIAKRVAMRAKSFGLRVIAYDPYLPRWEFTLLGVERVDSLAELLSQSDVVSAHVPINERTKNLIGAREIGLMKQSAYFVNTGRGKTVDQQALTAALKSKRIAGAALDVFHDEPLSHDDPLMTLDNVILTPHIAGYSEESLIAVRRDAAQAVVDALSGKRPQFLLNPQAFREAGVS